MQRRYFSACGLYFLCIMTAPSDGAYFQIDYVFRHVTCEHDILITWFETKFSRNHVCFTICEHMILCIRCVGSKPVSQIKFSHPPTLGRDELKWAEYDSRALALVGPGVMPSLVLPK